MFHKHNFELYHWNGYDMATLWLPKVFTMKLYKMTMGWSFSYYTFVKVSLNNRVHLQHSPFQWTPNIAI